MNIEMGENKSELSESQRTGEPRVRIQTIRVGHDGQIEKSSATLNDQSELVDKGEPLSLLDQQLAEVVMFGKVITQTQEPPRKRKNGRGK